MEDKRLTKRLVDYWDRLRKDLPLPSWERFNIEGLADVWGKCCVWRVEVASSPDVRPQYMYEYVGASAEEALGRNLTGMIFVSHAQQFAGARITKRINEVVQNRTPLFDEGSFVNERNRTIKYRSCLLPFGTKDGKVTHIVLGLSWRSF
jgi:hypothetical protein